MAFSIIQDTTHKKELAGCQQSGMAVTEMKPQGAQHTILVIVLMMMHGRKDLRNEWLMVESFFRLEMAQTLLGPL